MKDVIGNTEKGHQQIWDIMNGLKTCLGDDT